MLTPLQSLKQILQEHLEVCQDSEDYKAAIEDSIYGTDLSEIGIVEWCSHWLTNVRTISETDVDYLRGVQFVNDQWNIIKEKEDEMVVN